MKNPIKNNFKLNVRTIIALLFFSITANTMNAGGGEKKKKVEVFLHVEAKLDLDTDVSDTLTKVELYCHSELIDTKIPKKDGSFEFDLKKDLYYTIRITKKGYVPKIIGIDTELPSDMTDKKDFVFTTSMLTESDAKKLDKSVLEFPAALVMYYDKSASFEFCLEYATVRKAMLSTSAEKSFETSKSSKQEGNSY